MPYVSYYIQEMASSAQYLAETLEWPLSFELDPKHLEPNDFVLQVMHQADVGLPPILQLQPTGKKAPGATYVELASGAAEHRRKFGGGKGQMIAKAVGLKSSVYPQVLDATAGLGGDAFVLACLGCEMKMLERVPVIQSLLANGLERAQQVALTDDELSPIIERLSFEPIDAMSYLAQQPENSVDVVFLDPMFPEKQKNAAVKKSMMAFQSLAGKDLDADQLLPLALHVARYRVVVKRPKKAPTMNQQTPSYVLSGKSTRFDIYTKMAMPPRLNPKS